MVGFLIYSIIPSYYFNTLSSEINSTLVIYDSIKAVEITFTIQMLFYHAFFFFSEVLTNAFFNSRSDLTYFNPIAELVILRVIPTKDAKTEMETGQVTVEALISWCLI